MDERTERPVNGRVVVVVALAAGAITGVDNCPPPVP